MRAERWIWGLLVVAGVAFFTWLRSFSVSEYDLFWQIRAGHDILHLGYVPNVDSWSYVAQGHRWYNFEWLSCVVDYFASLLAPRYAGLYYLRVVLIATCLLMQAWIIRRIAGRGPSSWMALLFLLPVVFTMTFARFQMRPDLFATQFFLLLLIIGLSEISGLQKKILGLVLLVVWANFHGGTVPFGILLYATVVFSNARDLPWVFAAACTWCATPIGIHVFDVIRDNVLNYDYAKTLNPDFKPFTLSMFQNDRYWIFAPWPFYTLMGVGAYLWMILKSPEELPPMYRRWKWVAPAGLILTYLTYQKIRSIQYQVFFFLPILAAWMGGLVRRKTRVVSLLCVNAALLFCWFYIPYFLTRTAGMRGAEAPEWDLPIHSVDFIRRMHPAKNLFNAYNFGGYLIAELPEYPVAWDSREVPFLDFQTRYRRAFGSGPVVFGKFLDEYSIATVIDQYPVILRDHGGGLTDAYAINYPKDQWALTYFDDVSVVLMRRNPTNQPIIEKNEYRYLRPGLPFSYPLTQSSMTAEDRKGWESDADRCLAENPANTPCLLIKSAFAQVRGDLSLAKSYCEEAKKNPESHDAVVQCRMIDEMIKAHS